MREKEIETEIWKIIEDEIDRSHYSVFGRSFKLRVREAKTNIQKRIKNLLEKEQAILIYKP